MKYEVQPKVDVAVCCGAQSFALEGDEIIYRQSHSLPELGAHRYDTGRYESPKAISWHGRKTHCPICFAIYVGWRRQVALVDRQARGGGLAGATRAGSSLEERVWRSGEPFGLSPYSPTGTLTPECAPLFTTRRRRTVWVRSGWNPQFESHEVTIDRRNAISWVFGDKRADSYFFEQNKDLFNIAMLVEEIFPWASGGAPAPRQPPGLVYHRGSFPDELQTLSDVDTSRMEIHHPQSAVIGASTIIHLPNRWVLALYDLDE